MAATQTQPNGHAAPSENGSAKSSIQPSDVGWQFVPQYYNFVNKQPHRLHCFYNKRSTFIHGEEGEELSPALGQQAIHDRIEAIGYENCKVFIHSIDSQSSSDGGIIILVIGEMSNNGGAWRKFTQTFFLATQPNGYFVLNDIFRYLKEVEDEEEDDQPVEPAQQETAVEVPSHAPAPQAAANPVPVPPSSQPTPAPVEKDIPASTSTPQPETAPAHPDPKAVPTEAVVASVPDKDKAPQEAAAAVEEPVTTAPQPPLDDAPKAPASAPTKSAPAANGPSSAPSAPAAAPAAPPKPAAPKTWASMAAGASGGKSWASTATPAASSSSAPAPAAAPAAAQPQAAKKEESAPAPSAAHLEGKSQPYQNAMRVNTPHCFVKLPNWSPDAQSGSETMDENTLRTAAARFGEVKNVEIVKQKACAFVEFVKVESARKAIVASLSTQNGGEGGVKIGEGKLNFETRKEKEERRPKGPGGGNMGGQGGRGGANNDRGGRANANRGDGHHTQQSGGGRGGRGRGRGAGTQGVDRQQQK